MWQETEAQDASDVLKTKKGTFETFGRVATLRKDDEARTPACTIRGLDPEANTGTERGEGDAEETGQSFDGVVQSLL